MAGELTAFGALLAAGGLPACGAKVSYTHDGRADCRDCGVATDYVGISMGPDDAYDPPVALCRQHALLEARALLRASILLIAIRTGLPILAPITQAAVDDHAEGQRAAAAEN